MHKLHSGGEFLTGTGKKGRRWGVKSRKNPSNNWREIDCKLEVSQSAKINGSVTTEDEWIDSVQAAAYLKVSVGVLRNLTSNGQVPYYKLGRRNRYRTEDLREVLLSVKKGVNYGN